MRPPGARNTSGQDDLRRFTGKMKRLFFLIPAAAIICFPLPLLPGRAAADVSAAGATTGTIQGEVRITRKLTSQRMRFRIYPGFRSLAPPAVIENAHDERSNVIIYLKSTASTTRANAGGASRQIAQRGETFIPHVLPITQGTSVDFLNEDPIFHNVFSLSGTKSFDLGRYPKGESRSVTFERTGIVPVFCHLHSHMSAVIMVLDNPYFAVPDVDGHYRIEAIPPGIYTVVGWHERSERVEQQVEVTTGQSVRLDFMIPVEDAATSSQ